MNLLYCEVDCAERKTTERKTVESSFEITVVVTTESALKKLFFKYSRSLCDRRVPMLLQSLSMGANEVTSSFCLGIGLVKCRIARNTNIIKRVTGLVGVFSYARKYMALPHVLSLLLLYS